LMIVGVKIVDLKEAKQAKSPSLLQGLCSILTVSS